MDDTNIYFPLAIDITKIYNYSNTLGGPGELYYLRGDGFKYYLIHVTYYIFYAGYYMLYIYAIAYIFDAM